MTRGRIRAATGLKLPDAIVVASAVNRNAKSLISNDESLKKAAKLIEVQTAKEFASRNME